MTDQVDSEALENVYEQLQTRDKLYIQTQEEKNPVERAEVVEKAVFIGLEIMRMSGYGTEIYEVFEHEEYFELSTLLSAVNCLDEQKDVLTETVPKLKTDSYEKELKLTELIIQHQAKNRNSELPDFVQEWMQK